MYIYRTLSSNQELSSLLCISISNYKYTEPLFNKQKLKNCHEQDFLISMNHFSNPRSCRKVIFLLRPSAPANYSFVEWCVYSESSGKT